MDMQFSSKDFQSFSESTQQELVDKLYGRRRASDEEEQLQIDDSIDMANVVGLSSREIQRWMEKASDKTKSGLRVFAEAGPVIRARQLLDAGIDNISHFQSRVTIRTRTITGESDMFLFGWDDWNEAGEGEGKYAVQPETYRSLRRYFRLD